MPNDPILCVLDLETGGLDPRIHAIGSAALVRLDAGLVEVDRHAWAMTPTADSSPSTSAAGRSIV